MLSCHPSCKFNVLAAFCVQLKLDSKTYFAAWRCPPGHPTETNETVRSNDMFCPSFAEVWAIDGEGNEINAIGFVDLSGSEDNDANHWVTFKLVEGGKLYCHEQLWHEVKQYDCGQPAEPPQVDDAIAESGDGLEFFLKMMADLLGSAIAELSDIHGWFIAFAMRWLISGFELFPESGPPTPRCEGQEDYGLCIWGEIKPFVEKYVREAFDQFEYDSFVVQLKIARDLMSCAIQGIQIEGTWNTSDGSYETNATLTDASEAMSHFADMHTLAKDMAAKTNIFTDAKAPFSVVYHAMYVTLAMSVMSSYFSVECFQTEVIQKEIVDWMEGHIEEAHSMMDKAVQLRLQLIEQKFALQDGDTNYILTDGALPDGTKWAQRLGWTDFEYVEGQTYRLDYYCTDKRYQNGAGVCTRAYKYKVEKSIRELLQATVEPHIEVWGNFTEQVKKLKVKDKSDCDLEVSGVKKGSTPRTPCKPKP